MRNQDELDAEIGQAVGYRPPTTTTAMAMEYLTRAAFAIAAASRVTGGEYAIALGRCADVVEQAKRELEGSR